MTLKLKTSLEPAGIGEGFAQAAVVAAKRRSGQKTNATAEGKRYRDSDWRMDATPSGCTSLWPTPGTARPGVWLGLCLEIVAIDRAPPGPHGARLNNAASVPSTRCRMPRFQLRHRRDGSIVGTWCRANRISWDIRSGSTSRGEEGFLLCL